MEPYPTIILLLITATFFGSGAAFVVSSLIEKEKKAAIRGITITLIGSIILAGSFLLPAQGKIAVLVVLLALAVLLTILFYLPVGQVSPEPSQPNQQVDEREIIFARARLEPGSERYQIYYRDHPDHKAPDDASRNKPGLLSPDASLTDPLQSAAADASFFLTGALRDAVDGSVAEKQVTGSPEEFTQTIKYLSAHYGALDTGITELHPGHIYSHIGRGSGVYGDPVELDHQNAIAFTVEMDFALTGSAPYPPITIESGHQYAEFARVAVQLAAFIRSIGYQARAHIDGNYRVITPLVARDAGLGEIGRMGLLMTPRQGPRVRVGVVTTDLPLVPDVYSFNKSLIDFCRICKKCADNCPSQSIQHGDRSVDNGVLRWKINPESCYHYWTIVGTDCGKCMAVCPYSHPDNWVHNLVRWGITRSGNFRRAALVLDDFFYGKKPPSRNRAVLPLLNDKA